MLTYFEREERKKISADKKARVLAKEIMNLAFELHYTIPYHVECHFCGYVNSLRVTIHSPDRYNDAIQWEADYIYTKGQLVDLKKLEKVKRQLTIALENRDLPQPL